MRNEQLNWFNLKNYEASLHFKAEDWANEIIQRMISFTSYFGDNKYFSRDGGYSQAQYDSSLLQLNTIKEYGLLVNKLNQGGKSPQSQTIDSLEGIPYSKRFVSDLSELQAYSFLNESSSKKQIEKDFDPLVNFDPDNLMEGREIRRKVMEKYSNPISSIGADDQGYRYLTVDLNTSEQTLIFQFKAWLKIQHGVYEFAEMNFKDTDFSDWHQNRLLAYWDIVTIARMDGISLTNDAVGKLLFPNEYDVTLSERIRKVTRPNSNRLISYDTWFLLNAQARAE